MDVRFSRNNRHSLRVKWGTAFLGITVLAATYAANFGPVDDVRRKHSMARVSVGRADASPHSGGTAQGTSGQQVQEPASPLDLMLPSCDGTTVRLGQLCGQRGTIVVFLSTQCPISNGYIPTLNRLAQRYTPQGIGLVGINPNAGQSLADIRAHRNEYRIAFPVLRDPQAATATVWEIDTCPAVVLLDAHGRVAYRGRIDDRYQRRGGTARAPRRDDLEEALGDLLAGRAVRVPRTDAIGCPIHREPAEIAAAPQEPGPALVAPPAVTYARDVAPLLQRHCQECHRPGGVAPFSLTTYDDARSWAEDIRLFTSNGRMPPWKPVEGFGDFLHPRRMTAEEIACIDRWVRAGCPLGNPDELPPPREFSNDWALGEPDLVLTIPEYELAADGPDVYQCFVLPTDLDRDRFVTAFEVKPGNAQVVHHVIAFLDTSGRARQLDAATAEPGYTSSQGFPGFLPAGGLGGWAPGNVRDPLPPGIGRILPRGADVVLQVHYHKIGKPQRDRTQIGLYFARHEVRRAVFVVPVTPPGGPFSGMTIPAGAENHEVTGGMILPLDALAVTITPHMHLLGRDMKVTATLPDGTVQPLLYVDDWDFNWQETYQYRQLVPLPRGTRIDLVAHFDNSDRNPHNPNHPPQTVTWGEQTTDEMCIAFLELVPQQEAASQDQLRLPSRAEVLRFLWESQLPGQGTSWTRLLERLQRFAP
jgi:mono/diheme cytochrome c family protein